ncbi:hypothetical protein BO71DRAFT_426448 [Aspergillus ellipticus CBS 707.79]|uniref:Uncharacterized protein n=1 Tax=Aspergillus ellipticus CBS 707.79 TaxID=1448320 RepID=A0A319DKL4_9EURO|nr:hypothetical protein BO71DRAFT_426448 [Aspergillus ellipticus CBS 707.79]
MAPADDRWYAMIDMGKSQIRSIGQAGDVSGLSGVTEEVSDFVYVTGVNTTSVNIKDSLTNATHVWCVDFNIAAVFTSASYWHSIFAIDTNTGKAWEAIKNDLISDTNGIKVQDD